MPKVLYFAFLLFSLFVRSGFAQPCSIQEVNATISPCTGYYFEVTIDLEISGDTSSSFTLAGNGVIYGTWLYHELPVTIGPFLGDDATAYEFIAWDVQNPTCQNFAVIGAANCGPLCSISNFELEFITCSSLQSAIVVFDFEYANPLSNTFDLYDAAGNNIGSWLYESLPVTVPFFQTSGAAPIIVTVCDHNNPDCCETFTLPAIDCNPGNCEIFSISAMPKCTTGNNFVVNLDFGYDSMPSDSFTVTGNSLNYGQFAYTDLPVTLGPLNGNTNINWVFNIADSQMPSCNTVYPLGVYKCPPPCNVLALEALALECESNEAFALEIGLDIEGESDNGFAVFSETYYYGSYTYDNLPLVLSWQSDCSFIDQVSVCDNMIPGCCSTTQFEALQCCGCLIYNLTSVAQPCDENGQIYVVIDFDHINTSPEGFEISGNGTNYGQFQYEDLPVVLGPFDGDGSQYFEFVVTDLEDGFCFAAVELGFIACPDICLISDMSITTGDCSGYHQYAVTIDLEYQAVSDEGFDLWANGTLLGSYPYENLPITIPNFPSSGNATDEIMICDKETPTCCITRTFEAVSCECSITELAAVVTGCINEDQFGVQVEFDYENLPSPLVEIWVDDEYIGFFPAANQPISLQLTEGMQTSVIRVCANDLTGCCSEVEIERINCEIPVCTILELHATTGICTSDSTYILTVTFDTLNFPGTEVIVSANGETIGQFEVPANQLVFESFPVLGSVTELHVCAADDPECCGVFVFETPDCSSFGDCVIYDLIVDTGLCNSDSTFSIDIVFDTLFFPGNTFVAYANGEVLDTFDLAPIVHIADFPYTGFFSAITVCALEDAECCATVEFEAPDCSTFLPCGIFNLVVEAGECTSSTSHILVLDFDYQELTSNFVMVRVNNAPILVTGINEGHIVLENFPVTESGEVVVSVCDVNNTTCCDSYTVVFPDCSTFGQCIISNLTAETGGCTSDTTFQMHLDFDYQFLPETDSVIVTANGETVGVFAVSANGLTITQFPLTAVPEIVVTVCALYAADTCCAEVTLIAPDCSEPECFITNLVAGAGSCTSDSTYLAEIVFDAFNLEVDSVLVYANEVLVGQFPSQPGDLRIEDFPVQPGEEIAVIICAFGDNACCDTTYITQPFCGVPCAIFEIESNVLGCNSDTAFAVLFNFAFEGNTSDSFTITTGDVLFGVFGPGDLPAVINTFPSNSTGAYLVEICNLDNPECCALHDFAGPICGLEPCDIFNLVYEQTLCDSADQFYFILNFEFTNPGVNGFTVVGNGNNYGTFSYEELPVQLGPFTDDGTIVEFLVADVDNPGCNAVIVPGAADCPVGVSPVNPEDYFRVVNNGGVPVIEAIQPVTLTAFHINGHQVMNNLNLEGGSRLILSELPSGMYIALIRHHDQLWPVKLVKM